MVNVIRDRALGLYWKKERKIGKTLQGDLARGGRDIDAEKIRLSYKLVEAFQGEAAQDSCRFMMVNLSTKKQRSTREYAEGESVPAFVTMGDSLLTLVYENGIECVDLVPVFTGLDREQYYFAHGQHMNDSGHQVVASRLYEAIAPRLARSNW